MARSIPFEAIVLDVMLPDLDGFGFAGACVPTVDKEVAVGCRGFLLVVPSRKAQVVGR